MLGSKVVAASGLSGPGGDPATRLADMAIALRETCAAPFGDTDEPADFLIGLDDGPVSGGALGTSPGLFNLWGEAVREADLLAASAASGTIQASERAYLLLRQGFLFRPRGLFHRPGTAATGNLPALLAQSQQTLTELEKLTAQLRRTWPLSAAAEPERRRLPANEVRP